MKFVLCYIKNLFSMINVYFHTGIKLDPHIYEEYKRKNGYIAYTEKSFREVQGYERAANEKVTKATIVTEKCSFCGHKDTSWVRGWDANEEDLDKI